MEYNFKKGNVEVIVIFPEEHGVIEFSSVFKLLKEAENHMREWSKLEFDRANPDYD